MNALKKNSIKTVLKYTWPFYIVSALVIVPTLMFAFRVTHRLPGYKVMTLFVSGRMNDSKKLEKDLVEKYKDNELKDVSVISSDPQDEAAYSQKLTIPGYNTADILIVPRTVLETVKISAFGLSLSDELINEYYSGYSLFKQEDVNYGIKIDREKTKEYFSLPSEDCFMILNGKSVNTGKYSPKEIKEHDNALQIVKDWGM